MPLVLVAEPNPQSRNNIRQTLEASGYDVVEAGNALLTSERAAHAQPDVILLDVDTPVMDGFEVLRKLKENPITQPIPVVTTAAIPTARGEEKAFNLDALNYVSKDAATLMPVVRSVLRYLEAREADKKSYELKKDLGLIKTGDVILDTKLDGGIPCGRLVVVEGSLPAAEVAFCQRLTHQCLLQRYDVVYIATTQSVRDLPANFRSQSPVMDGYFRSGKLRIHHYERVTPVGYADLCGVNPDLCESPERLLLMLAIEIEELSKPYDIVVVETIH